MGEGGWHEVGKYVSESVRSAEGGIIRGAFRYRKIVGKKINSVDDAVSSGVWNVYSVVPIVFGSASNVPPGDAMG